MLLSDRPARKPLALLAASALAASVVVGLTAPAEAFTPDVKPRPSSIAHGGTHTLVLAPDGAVYGTGDTTFGQLPGQGVNTSPYRRTTLVPLTALPAGAKATAVAAGQIHSLVLGDNGVVYGSGGNYSSQLGTDSNTVSVWKGLTAGLPAGTQVARVDAGPSTTLVTTSTGAVYGMGSNAHHELGAGSTSVQGSFVAMPLPTGVTARQVDAGSLGSPDFRGFTIVLGSDNKLYGTGDNTFGQLSGSAATKDSLTPFTGLPAGTITAIAAGGASTYALIGGQAYAVGHNEHGQLGRGTATTGAEPMFAAMTGSSNSGLLGIDAGIGHAVAFSASGTFSVGNGDDGQLGRGAGVTTDSSSLVPVTVTSGTTPAPKATVEVSADSSGTVVRDADGAVFGTGGNYSNALTGPTGEYSQLIRLTGQRVIAYGTPTLPIVRYGTSTTPSLDRVWSAAPSGKSYQWYIDDAAISGQFGGNSNHYSPRVSDIGKQLKVRITGSLEDSTAQVTTGSVTVLPGLLAGGQVTVAGTAGVGRTLAATVPTLEPTPDTTTFQWLRNGVPIAGATGTTYEQVVADAGRTISARLSATLANYEPYVSTTSRVVPFYTSKTPTIKGTARVGKTLKVRSKGAWTPAPTSYAYQWLRNGVPIKKATKSSYKLTSKDKGKRIQVRVTARKSGVPSTSAVSARTSKVKKKK